MLDTCPASLRNTHVYVESANALTRAGHGTKALDLEARLDTDGVPLNAYVYSALLHAADKTGAKERAMSLVGRLRGEGVRVTGVLASQIARVEGA